MKNSLIQDPKDNEAQQCADKLKVLADPTRLHILKQLMHGAFHVGELNEKLNIEQSLLSHHLKILRDSQLVDAKRDGKAVLYTLSPNVRIRKKGIQLGCCQLAFNEK